MHLPRLTALALLASSFARLLAQDVIVTPLAWTELRDPPQELPRLKSSPDVRFPVEMKQTTDYGYVIYDALVDDKGRAFALTPHATLEVYRRASNGDGTVHSTDPFWKFSPGRRDGKPVVTATTFSYIFNPASAPEKRPDAAPRLLEVSLVRIPAAKGAKPADEVPDRVEMADLSVDEQGNVTGVKNAPVGLEEAFARAAKNWRFAPARRAGTAVAAEVRAPFIVVTEEQERPGPKQSQPRVIKQTAPVYPYAMLASRMRGEVVVDFIVDIEGRVRNAYVFRSLNPSFDDPALEAVRQWRFEPGRRGDRPVNTHLRVPVVFGFDDRTDGGSGPMAESRKGDLSKLPEEFRYDTPPRPVGTVRPVYPYELLRANKEGRAMVHFVVDQAGRVVKTNLGETTAPELARALQAAVECFTFEPAIRKGKPSLAIQGFSQVFNREDAWMLVTPEDLRLLRQEEKKPESILTSRDLDKKLTPLSQRPPTYPLSALNTSTEAEAVIEFLIDEDGRARLPRIISATEPAFGYAAVQGVSTWRFEPPTRGGRPAVVRVQVPIAFKLPPPPAKK
ncbi:MAG: TonB family protein [Verrucomicrobia bacterium]|nr:TonB family protein [Verrucomicrobiota bacterium]